MYVRSRSSLPAHAEAASGRIRSVRIARCHESQMLFNRKRHVHFVYAEEFRNIGSTVMRGEQLSRIATEHSTSNRTFSYSPTTYPFRRSILILTKNALKALSAEDLHRLRRRGNSLLFDVVDEAPPPTTPEYADAVIAASRSAWEDFDRQLPMPTFLVNHHVDPRLGGLALPAQQEVFRAGYFGELFNTVRSTGIERSVDFIEVSTVTRNDDWLLRLPGYSIHYAVRRQIALNHHKPFLKGFTAAHCGANILIQAAEREAVLWLGEDYPFLIHEEVDDASIMAAIDSAHGAFGTPAWIDGLERMREIRERTTQRAVAAEVEAMVSTFD